MRKRYIAADPLRDIEDIIIIIIIIAIVIVIVITAVAAVAAVTTDIDTDVVSIDIVGEVAVMDLDIIIWLHYCCWG